MTVGIRPVGHRYDEKGANHPHHDSRARTTERPRALAYVREGVFVTAPAPRGRFPPAASVGSAGARTLSRLGVSRTRVPQTATAF